MGGLVDGEGVQPPRDVPSEISALILFGASGAIRAVSLIASLLTRWLAAQPSLPILVLAVNLLALSAMWLDKVQAARRGRRIPEKALTRYALISGGPSVLIGAAIFRHKTRHKGLLATVAVATAAVYSLILSGVMGVA